MAGMTGLQDIALLTAAGVLGGLFGTAGGITSLVSYPALLAAGLPVLTANVTNLVAGVACWPGAALASQPELAGRGRWLRRWLPVSAAGGAAGAVLLLSTPPGVFARVVPFLVAAGALTLLAQPWLAACRERHRGDRPPGARGVVLPAGLVGMSVYGGYFGAGAGVMILALLLTTSEPRLPTANALKNMLLGAPALVSATALAAFGPVDWTAAIALGLGMFAGSVCGPHVARRLPTTLLRWLVALVGLALAAQLWLAPTH